jgi:parallel beta-helix repeat protein
VKRKVFSGIMLTLLLISMLKIAFDIPLIKSVPTTIIVPDDYPTIQEAINAANLGDTISVRNGTYHENVFVNKTVSLVGEDRMTTIIDGSNSGTVVYISANDVYVSGFTIRYSGLDFDDNGIRLDSSSNIVISGNVITNNTWGIWLDQASNNAISENIIANSSDGGIYLGASNNNVANENTITNNTYGMWLERSSTNNSFRGNIVTWNWMGISLAETSDGNTVYENTITKNDEGIHLFSDFNSIYENTIADNWAGIFSLGSEGNIIYRNNFINNTVQVDMGASVGVWDNGAEGNHWSDYDGQDLNGDGIGDTLLPFRDLDQYPLVEVWSQLRLFNVIWEEEKYHVTTFGNSTVASFNFNSSLKQISFNVTGPSDTVGFCNVTIPKSLLRGSLLILLDEADVTADTITVETSTHTFFYLSYGFSTHTVKIIGTDVFDKSPPVANAGPNQTVDEDVLVNFDGSRSDDNIGITSYTWTFMDETPQTLTGVRPTYIFANPGTYTVTLNVSDGAEHYATDTVVITVLDVTNPVAEVGFNASGSSDNVDIASYEWDFGDGFNGTGIATTHRYTSPGTYLVTLTVKDAANNTSTDSITVTVLSYFQAFRWWIVGTVALVGIVVAGIFFWKRKTRKSVI